MQAAIDAGVAFLLSAQAEDGSWCEWRLPPGSSRTWPTAYVGGRLRAVSAAAASPRRARLDRAAAWLAREEWPAGGWGYAPITGPDADTTALAMTFLRACGRPSCRAAQALLRHQQDDGGFATYARAWNHGAWTISHPDVTAAALHALADEPSVPRDVLSSARAYLQRMRQADGLWPSYWWTSPLYATERALSAGVDTPDTRESLVRVVRAVPTPSCFEQALQVLCLLRLADDTEALTRAATLAAAQSADGSWPSAPVLRLTHRHVEQPWLAHEAGPLFADEGRTFSTATAVAALDAAGAARRLITSA